MSELVEQVAKALEPLVDQRPAIDASASYIRSLQARALACAALSVLEPRIEQLERELAEARETLDCALDEYEGHLGRTKNPRHWSHIAAAIRSGDAG